jgi:hypothetical protein
VAHGLGQRALGREQAVVMRFRVPPDIIKFVEMDKSLGLKGNTACNQDPT